MAETQKCNTFYLGFFLLWIFFHSFKDVIDDEKEENLLCPVEALRQYLKSPYFIRPE